jgi:hypothetical protein
VAEHLTKAAAFVGAGAAVPFLVAAADDAVSRLALQQAERMLTDALVLIGQRSDLGAQVAAEHQVRGRLAAIHVYSKSPVEDDGSGLELPGEEAPFPLNPADPTSWWASMTLAVALAIPDCDEHFGMLRHFPARIRRDRLSTGKPATEMTR